MSKALRMTKNEILELLWRMDGGYQPTEEEWMFLGRVERLDLFLKGLESLPESLGSLTGLRELDLRGNRLTSLPESLGSLTGLRELSLWDNRLTSLPESLGSLAGLTVLSLSGNCLTSLPDWLGNLTGLTQLDLSRTSLTSLPESLGSLTGLTELDLSGNDLTSLPESLGSLTGLRELFLWGNHLTSLPESLGSLRGLTALLLGDNRLTSLPDWLGNLTGLTWLDLRGNHLDRLPASLLRLNLSFFSSYEAFRSNNLRGIYIGDTTLSLQPVSLFDQSGDRSPGRYASRKLIEDYFDATHIPLRESKVILLGDAAAGKTYTVKRLLNGCQKGDYHTEETHGILIEDLHPRRDGEAYTVRIWDFGGQDIMNEMHRCFLTERTCYVILIDTRNNGQTQRARRWLRTVRGVAPEAPVVLVVNVRSGGVNLDLDGPTLRKEFPNLREIRHCNARDAEEAEFRREVEEPLFRQALGMDSCKMTLPESWEQVRQELLALKKENYYIDRAGFHRLCDDHGVPRDDQLRVWLLNWFNDMGVCFSYHFEEGQERSGDYKILEPAWLTSAIYRLMWERKQTEDGIITRFEIDSILKKEGSAEQREKGVPCLDGVCYSPEEQGYVLDIMRMFSISYPVDREREFMPVLCKPDSKLDPAPEQYRQKVSVRFVYDLLPETVIHRLMIYCYHQLRPGRRWRTGFWLENETMGLCAVLHTPAKDDTLQIDVYARREMYDVSEWLQPLCKQVSETNALLKLKTEQQVLAENERGTCWFKLEDVWYWHGEGETSLMGGRNRYPIQPLLELLYGRWLPQAEELRGTEHRREMEQAPVRRPESWLATEQELYQYVQSLKEAINKNTKALERNSGEIMRQTSALQKSTVLLKRIQKGAYQPSERLMDTLLGIMEQNELLLESVEEIRASSEETGLARFRDLLGSAANAAALGQVFAAAWPRIQPLLPL